MENTIEKIKNIIEKIRPFLNEDGGDMEFVKFENGIVYIKLIGHCQECSLNDITIKENIEVAITSEIPEVIEVRNIN